jgi:hypothetical protein
MPQVAELPKLRKVVCGISAGHPPDGGREKKSAKEKARLFRSTDVLRRGTLAMRGVTTIMRGAVGSGV